MLNDNGNTKSLMVRYVFFTAFYHMAFQNDMASAISGLIAGPNLHQKFTFCKKRQFFKGKKLIPYEQII